MAVSIGRIGGLSSMMTTQPLNYSVENQSGVSSAYEESMQTNTAQAIGSPIMGAAPVQYPTAQLQENRISQLQESIRMDQAYNSIASEFSGYASSYDGSLQGMSYGMVGSNVDAYA